MVVLFQPAINQVHRWVQIGTFSFQASEVTKFAIVLSFAHLISINFKRMDTFRYGILPYLIILVPTLLLLAAEPHISCIAIVVLLAAGMLFIGGVKLRWFVIALSVIVGAILYLVIFTDNFSYANDRILGWLDPFNEQIWQETWQTRNSLYAIGSGGLLGLGLGNSRQKYLYLPEPQNDFIFAIVCEELGLICAFTLSVLAGEDLTYCNPLNVQRAANRFPRVTFTVSHGCWPFVAEFLGVALQCQNLYFYPDFFMNIPNMPFGDQFVRAANSYMRYRMMFATSYPVRPLKQSLDQFMELPLENEVRELLLWKNASRLLRL